MKPETSIAIPKANLTLPLAGRDHIQGPIDAPVSLVEYGDYQCQYCGAAYPIIKAVQKELGKKLCFAFRNFPLSNMHPYAEHAAEAAEGAAAQGRFWEMHDILFDNQESLDDESLAELAATVGLDAPRLMSEVLAGAHRERVREDFRSGVRGGVNGTPTLFINGVRFDAVPTAEALLEALTERGS
ncbi:MAG: Periplasmic thiol:disulfide interchange protein DsbA [Verrucomicrobiales bacterium]|nr:Periplasmic thiol:disulfide interchange protein DsbA [Verrucomicrobiales bacterium]